MVLFRTSFTTHVWMIQHRRHQVYIPLPRPIGYDTADEYKIMLSFDRTFVKIHMP